MRLDRLLRFEHRRVIPLLSTKQALLLGVMDGVTHEAKNAGHLCDDAEIDELIDHTLAEMLKKGIEDKRAPYSFAFLVGRRRMIDVKRRKGKTVFRSLDAETFLEPSGDQSYYQAVLHERDKEEMWRMVRSVLSSDEWLMIERVFFGDSKPKDIARDLRLDSQVVYKVTRRARDKLRMLFRKHDTLMGDGFMRDR